MENLVKQKQQILIINNDHIELSPKLTQNRNRVLALVVQQKRYSISKIASLYMNLRCELA